MPEVDNQGVVAPRLMADSAVKYMTKTATNATGETKHIAGEKKYRNVLSSDELKLLNAVRADAYATQKQLHEMTGISLGTIKRLLPKLQGKGLLVRIGNRRSGSWKINE